jgi:hypothetical protein
MRPNGRPITYFRYMVSMMASAEYFPFGTIVAGSGAT